MDKLIERGGETLQLCGTTRQPSIQCPFLSGPCLSRRAISFTGFKCSFGFFAAAKPPPRVDDVVYELLA